MTTWTKAGQFGPDAVVTGTPGRPATLAPAGTEFTLLLPDKVTKASLFTDEDMTAGAPNPFALDPAGNISLYAAPGSYWLSWVVAGVTTTVQVVIRPHPDDLARGASSVQTVAGVAPDSAGDVALTAANVGADAAGAAAAALTSAEAYADDGHLETASHASATYVPQARTVNGHDLTADVTVSKADVGLGSVDNTADVSKPVSTAQQTALDAKAPLASPAFTGTPTVNGSPIGSGGSGLPSTITTKTAAYTASVGDFVQVDATAGNVTITLPAAPAVGSLVTVKRTDASANTVTVAPSGAGSIDGDPTATIVSQWAGAAFEHIGADVWRVTAALSYPSGSLPDSGVTAGQYGDTTHVVQLTVDTQGRITKAVDMPITTGDALGTPANPVTDAAAARPSLPAVWWSTATQPANYVAATDFWMETA